MKNVEIWYDDPVIKWILDKYNVTKKNIMSKSRKFKYSDTRKLIAYYLRSSVGLTFQAIGDILGGRHPASVMVSLNTLKDLKDVDKDIAETIEHIDKISTKTSADKFSKVLRVLEESKDLDYEAFTIAINILSMMDKDDVLLNNSIIIKRKNNN